MPDHLPNSAEARDVLFHLHSQTNPGRHAETGPMVITHGEGVHVWDNHGKRYLEAMAGLWCTSLGFSDGRLKAAAAAAYDASASTTPSTTRRRPPRSTWPSSSPRCRPSPTRRCTSPPPARRRRRRWSSSPGCTTPRSGKPAKRKIIARDRGFHGSTIVAASMCGLPRMHREFGLPLPGFLHAACPDPYHGTLPGETPTPSPPASPPSWRT